MTSIGEGTSERIRVKNQTHPLTNCSTPINKFQTNMKCLLAGFLYLGWLRPARSHGRFRKFTIRLP